MTSATPYLSPEQFAEILAVESIVKAKVSAGFDYSRPVTHTLTRSTRLEWLVANTVCPNKRDPAKQTSSYPDHDANIEFNSLWSHCTANDRLCPKDWGTFYHLLKNKKQDNSGNWEPALPMDFSGWFCVCSNDVKQHLQLRFKQHVEWAQSNAQLFSIGRYLRALSETEWMHFYDF